MVSTGKRSTPRFASESPQNKTREGLADWRSEYISLFLSFLISRHGASDNSCKAFLEKTGPRIDFFHGETNYIQDTMGEKERPELEDMRNVYSIRSGDRHQSLTD